MNAAAGTLQHVGDIDTAHVGSDSDPGHAHRPSIGASGGLDMPRVGGVAGSHTFPSENPITHDELAPQAQPVATAAAQAAYARAASTVNSSEAGESDTAANHNSDVTGGNVARGATLQELAGLRRALGCSDTVKVNLPDTSGPEGAPPRSPPQGNSQRTPQEEPQPWLQEVFLQPEDLSEVLQEPTDEYRSRFALSGMHSWHACMCNLSCLTCQGSCCFHAALRNILFCYSRGLYS